MCLNQGGHTGPGARTTVVRTGPGGRTIVVSQHHGLGPTWSHRFRCPNDRGENRSSWTNHCGLTGPWARTTVVITSRCRTIVVTQVQVSESPWSHGFRCVRTHSSHWSRVPLGLCGYEHSTLSLPGSWRFEPPSRFGHRSSLEARSGNAGCGRSNRASTFEPERRCAAAREARAVRCRPLADGDALGASSPPSR
jgi:hypothetical protein